MSLELVKVEMKVNGKNIYRNVAPSMRLADFLRDELHLIGNMLGANQRGAEKKLFDPGYQGQSL